MASTDQKHLTVTYFCSIRGKQENLFWSSFWKIHSHLSPAKNYYQRWERLCKKIIPFVSSFLLSSFWNWKTLQQKHMEKEIVSIRNYFSLSPNLWEQTANMPEKCLPVLPSWSATKLHALLKNWYRVSLSTGGVVLATTWKMTWHKKSPLG